MRTQVTFTRVNKIETMFRRSRLHVNNVPRSTFTFTRGLSYIASYTRVNLLVVYVLACVPTLVIFVFAGIFGQLSGQITSKNETVSGKKPFTGCDVRVHFTRQTLTRTAEVDHAYVFEQVPVVRRPISANPF